MNTITHFNRTELFEYYKKQDYPTKEIDKFLDLLTEVANCKIIEGVRVVFSYNINLIITNNNLIPFFTMKFIKNDIDLELPQSELSDNNFESTVFLDANLAKLVAKKLSKKVLMGIIYHELGHIKNNHLNGNNQDRDINQEIEADEYAIKYGYGKSILYFLHTAKQIFGWDIENSSKDFNCRISVLESKVGT